MTLAIWGTEKVVRYAGTSVDDPAITALPTGGYVVGWRENQQLKFKLYDGLGNSTGTIYSLDVSAGDQRYLDFQAIGNEGAFAVSWTIGRTVKAVVFGPSGTAGTIQTLSTTAADYVAPLAAGPNGGFVSVHKAGEALNLSVHGADGAVVRTLHLNPDDQLVSSFPEVTQISENRYIVTYSKSSNSKVFYRIIDLAAAQPVGAELSAGDGGRPEVVVLKDADGNPAASGDFAIIKQNGGAITVKFSGVTQEVSVTATGTGNNDFMSATALRGGRVAVVLSGEQDGTGTANPKMILRIVDRNGDNVRLVLDAVAGQREPTVTELEDGRLSIAWVDPTAQPSNISNVIVDPRLVAVTVQGTAKNDTYVGSEHAGDYLYGHEGNDVLHGEKEQDFLYGGTGNDTLDGGDGDDVLYSGEGSDALNGGAGSDWADYSQSAGAVTANLSTGTGTSGDAEGDTYNLIENLTGSAKADILTGNGSANFLVGGGGNDTLYGGAGNDRLWGEAGEDRLYGGAGADELNGGDEFDTVSYQDAATFIALYLTAHDRHLNKNDAEGDTFIGIEGWAGSRFNDTMSGHNDREELYGYDGNDLLQGWGGHDHLDGEAGNDTLDGGAGNDSLLGGNHDDILIGHDGADTLDGDARNDIASYVNFTQAVRASLVTNTATHIGPWVDTLVSIEGLIGGSNSDELQGNDGSNTLIGGAGSDSLSGLGGNDTLEGGIGGDQLSGGAGIDFASYANAGGGYVRHACTNWWHVGRGGWRSILRDRRPDWLGLQRYAGRQL